MSAYPYSCKIKLYKKRTALQQKPKWYKDIYRFKHNLFLGAFLKKWSLSRTYIASKKKLDLKKTAGLSSINLNAKLVQFILKSGKKTISSSALNKALSNLALKLKTTKSQIILVFFLCLQTRVEVRKIRVRRRTHFVPFLISIERQLFLALKWLISAAKKNTEKKSFVEKIVSEISYVFQKKNSGAIALLEKNNQLAYKSRLNVNFRW